MADAQTYDYIIVGSGSAGSVLSSRLSEDAGVSVLVLEAGGQDDSFMRRIPAALDYALLDDKYNWSYYTDPEPFMDGRQVYCPRGKVIGGSSSINGMMYIRGHPLDYDGWAGNVLPEWSYAHCLPYFKKMESYDRGGDDYRGSDGPFKIATAKLQNPLDRAYLEAALQAGYAYSEDTNGFQQEGFGRTDSNTHNGARWSTADAYLRPAMARPNLKVVTRALTRRILFEGKRAIGVEYEQGGEIHNVHAEREVILSGGTINSPQLLLLSGVGAADHLAEHEIPLVADIPGVGRNLQDHLDLRIQVCCKLPVSVYPQTKGLGRLIAGLKWITTRKGVASTNLFEVSGYVRSNDGVAYPNLQLGFMAVAASYDGAKTYEGHGYQAHIDLMRPSSRGRVQLHSADPKRAPSIVFNYLQTESDRREVIDAVRITRNILSQEAFAPYDDGEFNPGPEVQSDEQILAWARAEGETEYHPTSTCTMGTDDNAVVDGDLRVHGLEGLRVVDASIMPKVVTANTQCTTIMIAEKAADLIAGRTPLEPSYVPLYQPE
ncbi:MAG: choline dehydrogenase [Alphaproteobacteria bacterium]|jgi:choline dehydrogenase|nr:choline dehydrogenase [Rhodospirillaceae bacterium]MBT6202518.1 choline dehydrogenase [Rhodospirillaceae bacterium]MBT6512747.1 choline dehydrogenase [Rhodospirillaceae bacterium]MBT7646184.1 choline dehydrogenase [Rhodospirillaceae bacterium]MDG2479297.1 choline dehydrogenase [Alphaproteobacteria bacterium]